MASSATLTFADKKLEPYENPTAARMQSVRLAPSLNLARGTVLGEIIPLQVVTITGTPTGGTFTLTYLGKTTAAIAYNAAASAVASALAALTTIGAAANVAVTGSAGGPYTVTIYTPTAANPSQYSLGVITATASLTGGTSPGVTVAWSNSAVKNWGIYTSYASSNTDGSQTPKAIAAYDTQTDASGNVTFSSTSSQAGGEWGQTSLGAPAYYSGVFRCEELVGLDSTAVTDLGGNLVQGTVTSGIFQFGV